MRYFKKIILVVIMSAFICLPVKAEMTLKELFYDESKPFHLKILDVIPEEGIVQIGDENANNTIIEFMDYFCGYCKKVHPELLQIASERKELTSGSTWHAAGLLPLFNMSYSVGQLHKYAVKLYKTLEEETGQKVGFSVVSNIRLATTQDRMDEYYQYSGVAKTIGVDVKFLTP